MKSRLVQIHDGRAVCLVGPYASYFGRFSLEPGVLEVRSTRPIAFATGVRLASDHSKVVWATEVKVPPNFKRLMIKVGHAEPSVFVVPLGIDSERMIEMLKQNGFDVLLEDPPRRLPRYFVFIWLYFRFRKSV